MTPERIDNSDSRFPVTLAPRLQDATPGSLYTLGDVSILRRRLLGLICSIQCPGSLVIQTFDAMRALREARAVVVGGFHSPMEVECLDILLRGSQPVVLCPARGLRSLRLGDNVRKALMEGRLLVLTSFGEDVRRTVAARAMQRNEIVAALGDMVLVPHAAPGGKTEGTARNVLARGQPLFTFADENNTTLIQAGAEPFDLDRVAAALVKATD